MKQVFQDLKSGELALIDCPVPAPRKRHLIVASELSLISAGTERMLNSFAKSGYISKARQQPDKIKQVMAKAKTEGLYATYEAVSKRLAQPLPLGYSNVGYVISCGEGCSDFSVGDRVVSNGPHAEFVSVSQNLAARIPEEVSSDQAAYTVVGSIGLQGIRLIDPQIGETVCVVGLGLIGLIAVQILLANGCRVIGFDFDPSRVELAKSYGAMAICSAGNTDIVSEAMNYSRGRGVDAVLITASTNDTKLVNDCAAMTRKRGRIVLTGVVGLELNRAAFYEKEISFQVSCSYGPGRYDASYEEQGIDYPFGFVRWTERRNFEAVLDLMAAGRINTTKLTTLRTPFADAASAYTKLSAKDQIGILLEYDAKNVSGTRIERTIAAPSVAGLPAGKPAGGGIGIIGAGNFTQMTLVPNLVANKARIVSIASRKGSDAAIAARSAGGNISTTSDIESVFSDPDVSTVVITTRHDSHADLTIQALNAGKNVVVEKPLAILEDDIDRIVQARADAAVRDGRIPLVLVGFNRRFAPFMLDAKKAFQNRSQPMFVQINCNAGAIPSDNWQHDPNSGGGRIIGEACHFFDIARYIVNQPITSVRAAPMLTSGRQLYDTAAIVLGFADGSLANVNYFANGAPSFPKEHYLFNCGGKSVTVDNFRRITGHGVRCSGRTLFPDKGHRAFVGAFLNWMEHANAAAPIDFDDTVNVAKASFAAVKSLENDQIVPV